MVMMPMWFTWTVNTILWVRKWHPTSLAPYLATCLLLVACGIGHEALASWRVSFLRASPAAAAALGQGYAALPAQHSGGGGSGSRQELLRFRVLNSCLYAANMATGYLLMLAVMTFNVGIFASVVVGMGLGHFLCFHKPWHLGAYRVDACCETVVGADF